MLGSMLGWVSDVRRPGIRDDPAMPEPAPIDLHLVLSPASEPVAGRLVDPDGAETPFEGYVELIAAIERHLEPVPDPRRTR
jgi:hypothetical protein